MTSVIKHKLVSEFPHSLRVTTATNSMFDWAAFMPDALPRASQKGSVLLPGFELRLFHFYGDGVNYYTVEPVQNK